MSLWENLTTEQLYTILECKNFQKIHKRLKQFAEDMIRFDRAALLAQLNQQAKTALAEHQIAQTLFAVINSEASYPAVMLLAALQAVSLTFLPIIIMAPICGALTLAVGIYFYVATYKEFKRISDLNQDDLDFSHIKLACTQEIIIRHEAVNINNNDNHAALKPFIKPFDFKNENRLRRFSSAVSTTLLTGGVLFATCYLTAAVILSTLAVTSVLLGPIGLCVAAGAALLIGAYAGYKQYQSLYNNEKLTAYKKHLDEQLLKKCKKCDELRGVRRPKKLYVRSLSDTDLAGERKAHLDPYFESTVLTQRRNFLDKRPVVATLAPEPDLHKSTRNKL